MRYLQIFAESKGEFYAATINTEIIGEYITRLLSLIIRKSIIEKMLPIATISIKYLVIIQRSILTKKIICDFENP